MMARQERVVDDPDHEDVQEAIRLMRDEGFGARIETKYGQRLITAVVRDDYEQSKKQGQKVVDKWRLHDRRERMLNSHYEIETFETLLYLQPGYELVPDPLE